MSSFTEWQSSTEIIMILCIYSTESDLFNLCECMENLREAISSSELICKEIILRDSHFLHPGIEFHSLRKFHLICNQNNSLLMKNHWFQIGDLTQSGFDQFVAIQN